MSAEIASLSRLLKALWPKVARRTAAHAVAIHHGWEGFDLECLTRTVQLYKRSSPADFHCFDPFLIAGYGIPFHRRGATHSEFTVNELRYGAASDVYLAEYGTASPQNWINGPRRRVITYRILI